MNHRVAVRLILLVVAGMLWGGWLGPWVWSTAVALARGPAGGEGLVVLVGMFWLFGRGLKWAFVPGRPRRLVTGPLAVAALRPADSGPGRPCVPHLRVLVRRARHESAHAVTAWAQGGAVTRVDLIEVGGRGGQCCYDFEDARLSYTDQVFAELVVTVAGNQIDLVHDVHDHGSRDDMLKALVLAALIISTGQAPTALNCDLSSDSLIQAARSRAGRLLQEHSGSADSLTGRLLEQPALDAEDLAGILGAPPMPQETASSMSQSPPGGDLLQVEGELELAHDVEGAN